jgi:hypothetical protein
MSSEWPVAGEVYDALRRLLVPTLADVALVYQDQGVNGVVRLGAWT